MDLFLVFKYIASGQVAHTGTKSFLSGGVCPPSHDAVRVDGHVDPENGLRN